MKRFEDQTHYEVLEVEPGASPEEVRRAYEKLREVFAPGSITLYSLVDQDEQRKLLGRLEEAFLVLTDERARTAYDERHGIEAVRRPPPPGPPPKPARIPIPAPQFTVPAAAPAGAPAHAQALVAALAHGQAGALAHAQAVAEAQQRPAAPTGIIDRDPASDHGGAGTGEASVASGPPRASLGTPHPGAPSAGADLQPGGSQPRPSPGVPGLVAEAGDEAAPGAAAVPAATAPAADGPGGVAPREPEPSARGQLPLPEILATGGHPPAWPGQRRSGASEGEPEPAAGARREPASAGQPPVPASPPAQQGAASPEALAPQAAAAPPPLALVTAPAVAPAELRPPPAPRALQAVPQPPVAPEVPASPPMPEIGPKTEITGELLRLVREARGLALKEVSTRTRIGVNHLENLEAEAFDKLPERVYLRGFLTSYARELRLDANRVCDSYLARWTAARGG